MKKMIALVLSVVSIGAHAAANDMIMTQIDQWDTGTIPRLLTLPGGGANGIFYFDGTAVRPKFLSVGTGCSITSNTLNCPGTGGTGTVTSITAGTGLSGGVITTSGTISLPNTGTAGTYNTVTTDAQGRVTAGTSRSQSSASRSLNSGFQISSTRDAMVYYSIQATVTASIGSGQDGDLFLDIASDSGFTTNLQTLAVAPCSQTYTLAVALQGVQKCPLNVSGYVPASYYTRLRTVNNVGTPSFSYRAGQEVLL